MNKSLKIEFRHLYNRVCDDIFKPTAGMQIDRDVSYNYCCIKGTYDNRFHMGADIVNIAKQMDKYAYISYEAREGRKIDR